MPTADKKAPRGRPRTFDRNHVIAVAMNAYWEEGQSEVSLNAVCKLAKVSKPSLYQEFGGEDGLKRAVLTDYHKMTLAPLYEMLAVEQPFDAALVALKEYILRDHREYGMPLGCLFVDMCQCRDRLGEQTRAKVDEFRDLSVNVLQAWIERARANGELNSSILPRTASIYIDAQIASIMNMQRQGVLQEDIAKVFQLALSVFE
ncbi:MAG: TetR/AcrR family transcriptional regulator [Pseudomonadota bacterium]